MSIMTPLQVLAASLGDDALDVADVFSTDLYTGNGSAEVITNGLNLSGEGGMIWTKARASAFNHMLADTVRGVGQRLITNTTNAEDTVLGLPTSFNPDGYTLGAQNLNTETYVGWSFRKAAKFFDVVTYTGDGTSGRTISHNLGVAPGMIVVKRRDSTSEWFTWHRSLTVNNGIYLNQTTGEGGAAFASSTDSLGASTADDLVVSAAGVNVSGNTYVAYLFAHDTSDSGIIQCGSYTGNGSASGPTITLGWEPQWLLIKRATGGTGSWYLMDTARGMSTGATDAFLLAEASNAEATTDFVDVSSTGFEINIAGTAMNSSGDTYIYMAVRSES